MVNIDEICNKLLTQFKNNHQRSISDEKLSGKLVDKYPDIDFDEMLNSL